MQIDQEEIAKAMVYFELAEELKPLAKKAVEIIMSYGTEIKPLVDAVNDCVCDSTMRMITGYMARGLSKEDAILLTVNSRDVIKTILENITKNLK
jgi:hypothetical protein